MSDAGAIVARMRRRIEEGQSARDVDGSRSPRFLMNTIIEKATAPIVATMATGGMGESIAPGIRSSFATSRSKFFPPY